MTEPDTKPKRVHKPARQRRAEILEAATRVFAARGYKVADMQAVADDAGVGKGTVYRHFPTKADLFTEALRYNLDALRDTVEQAREQPEDPLAQLREAMRAYLQFFERNPDLIELFVQERAEFRRPAQSSLYFAYAMAKRDEWVALFERIAARYPLRDIDAQEWMAVFGDLLHGALVLSRSPLPRRPLSERFEAIFDIYLHGILKQ